MKEISTPRIFAIFRKIFNLNQDADEKGTIENIRKNVDFHGANAWTLVFAIFIASIGLNVNSTAVIIGAMLISPLMGPILGIGLSLGINDETLLRRSLRNLGIAVLISIITSTIYFLLSPFHEVQSELLARTSPTFYDVLIALFGGAAGIVSISRKERGPSVAGVAIATALMPPLCTAGYALANGNFAFLAGAIYLFSINSVFISLSTLFFVRYMKFSLVEVQDESERSRARRWISVVVVVMVLPSIYFAWSLLQQSRFKLRAEKFLREQVSSGTNFVVQKSIKYKFREPEIDINLIGAPMDNAQISELRAKLPLYDLANVKFTVNQVSRLDNHIPAKTAAEAELTVLKSKLDAYTQTENLEIHVSNEIKALIPHVNSVHVTEKIVEVVWSKRPAKGDLNKVRDFLLARLQKDNLNLRHLLLIK